MLTVGLPAIFEVFVVVQAHGDIGKALFDLAKWWDVSIGSHKLVSKRNIDFIIPFFLRRSPIPDCSTRDREGVKPFQPFENADQMSVKCSWTASRL